MAPLSRLFLVACLSVFPIIFSPDAVHALATDSHALALRHDVVRGHEGIARRQLRRRSCPAKSSTTTHHTTTTPKATPKPTPKPAPPPSHRKVGLGWTNDVPNALHYWDKPSVGGLYTWSPWCPPDARSLGIPCYPTLWGPKDYSEWFSIVKEGYSTMAIGCNEVNLGSQANLSPSAGASAWRKYMIPLRSKGYRLASHSVTNGPDGINWWKQWFDECSECRDTVDFMNVHFYGTDPNNFIDYIKEVHSTFGKSIIVTEVACQSFSGQGDCSVSDAKHFLETIADFMQSQSWVYQYYWFGLSPHPRGGVSQSNALMNENGSPNALGEIYLNPPS